MRPFTPFGSYFQGTPIMNTSDHVSISSREGHSPRASSMESYSRSSSSQRSALSTASSYGNRNSSEHNCTDCRSYEADLKDIVEDDFDFIDTSDDPPVREHLADAGNINIFDAEGNSRPFRSLYQGPEHQGQRQLIIFVRHFYCGACQSYLKALTQTITPSAYFSLPIPTTITIIGCGKPSLIPAYGSRTHCPFRMYADPSRQLYKIFNLGATITWGKRPEYIHENVATTFWRVGMQVIKAGPIDGTAGGHPFQVGGEMLFEDGAPIWFHRMRNIRGHAEMAILKRILGLEDPSTPSIASARDCSVKSPSPWPPEHRSQRSVSGLEKVTSIGDVKTKGLRLVFDERVSDRTGAMDVPRARLVRNSREIGV